MGKGCQWPAPILSTEPPALFVPTSELNVIEFSSLAMMLSFRSARRQAWPNRESINILPVWHFALGAALRRDGAREAGAGRNGQLQHDDSVRAVRLCAMIRVHKEDRA